MDTPTLVLEGNPIGRSRRTVLRQLAAAAGVAGAAGVAVACASSGSGGSAPAQTSKPLDRGVKEDLVWLIWSSNTGVRGDAYNAMTKTFQERFPNVTAT